VDDAELLPSTGRWLKRTLEEQKMSRGALARLIGRSREEVQRWTSEREQIPRHHLAEAAVQLGADEDLDYLFQLKNCEDLAGKLRGQIREFARRTGCGSESATDAVIALAREQVAGARCDRPAAHAETYLRRLTDAQFVFRSLTHVVSTGDSAQLLSVHNIHRHVRYPVNHFLGLGLDLAARLPAADAGNLAEFRSEALHSLRGLVAAQPAAGAEELVRDHAVHILGRHGAPEDRVLVQDVIQSASTSTDPFGVRLGYMGLIMHTRDPETVDRYLALLSRDHFLARADINFDAVHYGDITLQHAEAIPATIVRHDRLVSSIMRRLEHPDTYRFISELDSYRLLAIMDHAGRETFQRPGVIIRLLRICAAWGLPPRDSLRQQLERRVFMLADQCGIPTTALRNGAIPVSPTRLDAYDIFIGYNSTDRAEVLKIVQLLQARGIRTWVDELDLPPGRLFQDEIERVLRSCRSAALFVGSDGAGPWERLEIKAAISQYVKRGLPVIPVLLDDTAADPHLPMFLREFRMVRLGLGSRIRSGLDDLVWGITGAKPMHVALH
jgi:transcriptional regulator with XRE-family HTH domain